MTTTEESDREATYLESSHGRRRFLTAMGSGGTALLAGCSSSDSPDETLMRAWFRVRSNGNIQFALEFEGSMDAEGLGDPGQFVKVSNDATVELDESISLNWYEHATVEQGALSQAEEKLGADWGSSADSYVGSVDGAEQPTGITGRIKDAVASVNYSQFGEIELEVPEIAVKTSVMQGTDTVQIQYPDGQIHSAPYIPPSLDEEERVITDESFDGEFRVDFENERIRWESKHYDGQNEWEFPTGIPTQSLNTRQVDGTSATILVENSIVALSPAYGSLRAVWRSRWEFFDWVASIAVDPTAAAEQVGENSKEIVRETLGWLGPTGSSDAAEQYMVAGLQVGVALRYTTEAARVAGAVVSTLTTAADIALGYQKVTSLAEETKGLIEDVIEGFNYSYINPAVHPLLHRFMAEKASISIATHNGDSNLADYQTLVERIASEYDAVFTQIDTEYASGDGETRQLQSRIHDSVKSRVEVLKSAKVNNIIDEALMTDENRTRIQPITQFQLDDANTGFGPNLREPGIDSKQSVEYISSDAFTVRPVIDENRVYGCSADRIIAFDRDHEIVWEHRLSGGGDIITTPTIDGGVLYVGTDEPAMYALELDNDGATQQWHLSGLFDDNPLSPTVHDGHLYTATRSQYLYQIGISGEVTKRVELSFGGPTSPRQSLAIDGQRIFVSGMYGTRAFELDSLTPTWETVRETADYTNDVPAVSTDGSPTVYSPEGNELIARKPTSGDVIWRSESGIFASVPTIGPERVLIGTESRRTVRAYPRGQNDQNPRAPIAEVELDDDIVGEMTIAGDHVYCSTDQSVYCLSQKSLETVWKISERIESGRVTSTPVITGGRVYVATSAGIVAIGSGDGS